MYNLRNRSFLKEIDFTARELEHLLRLSAALKTVKYAGTEVPRLTGKSIALIFEKTSTRTRSAFEVAASPASIVFEQAENRLHTIKAILVATIGS